MSWKSLKHLQREKGFTLIELLLVIGIIAVLATIVIIAINPTKQLGAAVDVRRHQSVNQMEKALSQYLIDHGQFPGDIAIPEGVGNALPICRASESVSDASCINLDLLIEYERSYMACLPRDGSESNEVHTGFTVYQEAGRARIASLYLGENSGGGVCESLPQPVAYWRLDETGAGATVKDASGNGRDGTPNGTGGANALPQPNTDTAPTRFANVRSIDFDGTDDYINVGTFNVSGDAITLSAWFKAEAIGEDPRILSKAEGWQTGEAYWLIGINDAPDRLRLRLNTADGERSIDQGSTAVNIWTHIAGVYDGSIMRLYKDGSEIGTQVHTGNIRTGPASVWIGANPPTVSDRPFNGLIDDVRIYDTALTPGQILSLARGNP